MTSNSAATSPAWNDDDIPELTDDELDRAEFSIGKVVIRPARDRTGD